MARGLKTKWKQPLAYFLVSNTTSAERLKLFVEHCIMKLSAANFNTVCVICDQGSTNQQMFKLFGISQDKPYATVDSRIVHFMFDPPHLLKSVRNNLMKHDLELNGKLIKWDYIVKFYEKDCKQMLKLVPKLTDKHLNLPPFAGMRV
jgi:DNA transposase THAP9